MANSSELSFVSQAVEKEPFAALPVQGLFAEWCRVNGSITPLFIPRSEWEVKDVVLESNVPGEQKLFLPNDLHLWEMMGVIRAVDYETFAKDPTKRDERANQIHALGVIFEKSGLYLSQYVSALKDGKGKHIALAMANEFYWYGVSLQNEKKETTEKNKLLTEEDKTQLDAWFLGRDVYQSRLSRLGTTPSAAQIEETRKDLLQVWVEALGREGYKGEEEKFWKTKVGPMQYLQDRTRLKVIKAIETPERELNSALFRRGSKQLVTDMNEVGRRNVALDLLKSFGLDLSPQQRKLYDTLDVDGLKQELDFVRRDGTTSDIASKELEIAQRVQKLVSRFSYISDADKGYKPSEMLETQEIDCLGAQILGGGLLDEMQIKYLVADLPDHAATVLITSDGRVRWQDFSPRGPLLNYKEIHNSDITGDVSVSDIVQLANSSDVASESLRFEINKFWYNLNIASFHVSHRYIGLLKPETGLQCLIFYRIGNDLCTRGLLDEAIEAYRQALNVDPKVPRPYYGLGNIFSTKGEYAEALEAYRQALNVDPQFPQPYYGLGSVYSETGDFVNALRAYQVFIELWDGDKSWRERANNEIEKLRRQH